MKEKKDILTQNDVQLLVNTFYDKIRANSLLSAIFNKIIQDRWPQHLEKMYRFWQTVLLNDHTYFGSPFPPHAGMPIEQIHFDTWLKLWYETIDQHFSGEKCDEAKWRSEKMASMFLHKIEYYRNNPAQPLV